MGANGNGEPRFEPLRGQFPRRQHVPDADRLLVVISDVEMGAGGSNDDFPHSDFLGALILGYNAPEFADIAVDLVFNGDTFDFLKTPFYGNYPHHINAGISLEKFKAIAAAHPEFFDALTEFLSFRGAPRRVHFVLGNHDLDLVFPEVKQALRERVGPRGSSIAFCGLQLEIGDVHVEHGSQSDNMFRVDPRRPFVEYRGESILNLPWGAVALLDVAMPLQPVLYHLDRVKPRSLVFELIPEAKDLLVGAMWTYWTRDWFMDFFSSDPMKKVDWTMFKEVAYRFSSYDVNVHPADVFTARAQADDRFHLFLSGHMHEPGWWSFGNRKVLRTGCLRNEFMVAPDGIGHEPLPKVYAEVYLRRGRVARTALVEVEGPPPPEGYVPESLFDILPVLRPLLASEKERTAIQAAAREQEAREAREAARGE